MQLGFRFSFAFKPGFKRRKDLGLEFFLSFIFFFFVFYLFETSTSKAASAAWLQVLGAKGAGHLPMGAEEQSWAPPSQWPEPDVLCPQPNHTVCCCGSRSVLPVFKWLSRCLWLPKAQSFSSAQEAGRGREDHCSVKKTL